MRTIFDPTPFLWLGSKGCPSLLPGFHGWRAALWMLAAALGLGWTPAGARAETGVAGWHSPLVKMGKLNSPLVEVTPFVFGDRLYRLENWRDRKVWEGLATNDPDQLADEIRIRDMATGQVISVPLRYHSLGTAFVWGNRCYVFAGNQDKPAYRQQISMTYSEDLLHWSKPMAILERAENEQFFNVAVCRGSDHFVLLVESSDPAWPAFTFKYFESDDLEHWKPVPGGLYGRNKYVGGPDLHFEGGYYYTLYLESLGGGKYETRITRSKDLVHWQDAPDGRPFLTFDPSQLVHPLRSTVIHESNASDPSLCYWHGKTLVYFTGGRSAGGGGLAVGRVRRHASRAVRALLCRTVTGQAIGAPAAFPGKSVGVLRPFRPGHLHHQRRYVRTTGPVCIQPG
ncbi:MAG: hypothetical protein M1608_09305 [Candidatus Omnitrophica bacterium]|nr:hypothetical protein [Candidatus Omnitrophota bacterium]